MRGSLFASGLFVACAGFSLAATRDVTGSVLILDVDWAKGCKQTRLVIGEKVPLQTEGQTDIQTDANSRAAGADGIRVRARTYPKKTPPT